MGLPNTIPLYTVHNYPGHTGQYVQGYPLDYTGILPWPTQQAVSLLQDPSRGIPLGSVPPIETMTPQLRQNIVQGKDINLAFLLIPN